MSLFVGSATKADRPTISATIKAAGATEAQNGFDERASRVSPDIRRSRRQLPSGLRASHGRTAQTDASKRPTPHQKDVYPSALTGLSDCRTSDSESRALGSLLRAAPTAPRVRARFRAPSLARLSRLDEVVRALEVDLVEVDDARDIERHALLAELVMAVRRVLADDAEDREDPLELLAARCEQHADL